MAALAAPYRPRRPTETVLYETVRQNLETFLAYAREHYSGGVPRYVEAELRGYLRCGVFAHGFVRAHCDACGHDLLVAFSCKARSICPSCAGRRMANTAAHLVDRVLPAVPVRQWVLSLPWELRALAAFKADVLSALVRMFIEAIFARYNRWARGQGLVGPSSGAVTHVQRFGSSLNLNAHFHVMVLDGVYTRDDSGTPTFHVAPSPTRDELDAIVRRVSRRAVGWLERKGHVNGSSSEGSQDQPAQTSLEACAAVAMGRGIVRALRDDPDAEDASGQTADGHAGSGSAVERDGFNVHAGIAIAADDDLGRERLMRYGARPPLALDRLRRLHDGRIAYRIKNLRDGRAKHRVMTPLEFLARLSALVPPPRYPLLRYHGALAPRSPWRRDIVPRPRDVKRVPCATPSMTPAAGSERRLRATSRSRSRTRDRIARDERSAASKDPSAWSPTRAEVVSPLPMAAPPKLAADVETMRATDVSAVAPNVVSVKHWNRLLGGQLYAATPRVDWARLLRRSFDVDVLVCSKCGGRLRILGEVTDPAMVRLVLESLGMSAEVPCPARARDPTLFDYLVAH